MGEREECPKCGTVMAETGAPIWEIYCPNKECTHPYDQMIAGMRAMRKREEKQKYERVARAIAACKRGVAPGDPRVDKAWTAYVGQAHAAIHAYLNLTPTNPDRRD